MFVNPATFLCGIVADVGRCSPIIPSALKFALTNLFPEKVGFAFTDIAIGVQPAFSNVQF